MVKTLTSVCTLCEAMKTSSILVNAVRSAQSTLSIPHNSYHIGNIREIFFTTQTSTNYLHSTMTEQRLNHCLLLHMQKHITDSLDIKGIAKEFIVTSEEHSAHFGTLNKPQSLTSVIHKYYTWAIIVYSLNVFCMQIIV